MRHTWQMPVQHHSDSSPSRHSQRSVATILDVRSGPFKLTFSCGLCRHFLPAHVAGNSCGHVGRCHPYGTADRVPRRLCATGSAVSRRHDLPADSNVAPGFAIGLDPHGLERPQSERRWEARYGRGRGQAPLEASGQQDKGSGWTGCSATNWMRMCLSRRVDQCQIRWRNGTGVG